jgi:hypothetical protein
MEHLKNSQNQVEEYRRKLFNLKLAKPDLMMERLPPM